MNIPCLRFRKPWPSKKASRDGTDPKVGARILPTWTIAKCKANDPKLLFDTGTVLITWNSLHAFELKQLDEFLSRHFYGDWRETSEEDQRANEKALREGGQVVSCHSNVAHDVCYVVTAADRWTTTMYWGPEWDWEGSE